MDGSPAEGSIVDKPFSERKGFVTNVRDASLKLSAEALMVMMPGVVVDLIRNLFTPPSTGKPLAKI